MRSPHAADFARQYNGTWCRAPLFGCQGGSGEDVEVLMFDPRCWRGICGLIDVRLVQIETMQYRHHRKILIVETL